MKKLAMVLTVALMVVGCSTVGGPGGTTGGGVVQDNVKP
jgi:uncharacterized protein YceK